MISVTAYYRGKPICFGRGETELEARKNAKALADVIGHHLPRLSDPLSLEYRRDDYDKQLFQPRKGGS